MTKCSKCENYEASRTANLKRHEKICKGNRGPRVDRITYKRLWIQNYRSK